MLRPVIAFTLRQWLAIALATSLAMLAIAHAFQTFGGLQPCHLCLEQRTVYWVAIPVALVGLALSAMPGLARQTPLIGWLLALVFMVGAGIAVFHAGAEWKWWSAPESCSGIHSVTAADLARLMRGERLAKPRCDVAAWRFLGLSMAGWNALISVKLAGWSIAFAVTHGRAKR